MQFIELIIDGAEEQRITLDPAKVGKVTVVLREGGSGATREVKVTDEGVIVDQFVGDECTGTFASTHDEMIELHGE